MTFNGLLASSRLNLTLNCFAAWPQVPGTPGHVVIEASDAGTRLLKPELAGLSETPMHPSMLLRGAADLGLPLFMEDRNTPFAGVALKDAAMERRTCEDVACIANRFLIAHSKWNLQVSVGLDNLELTICRRGLGLHDPRGYALSSTMHAE